VLNHSGEGTAAEYLNAITALWSGSSVEHTLTTDLHDDLNSEHHREEIVEYLQDLAEKKTENE